MLRRSGAVSKLATLDDWPVQRLPSFLMPGDDRVGSPAARRPGEALPALLVGAIAGHGIEFGGFRQAFGRGHHARRFGLSGCAVNAPQRRASSYLPRPTHGADRARSLAALLFVRR